MKFEGYRKGIVYVSGSTELVVGNIVCTKPGILENTHMYATNIPGIYVCRTGSGGHCSAHIANRKFRMELVDCLYDNNNGRQVLCSIERSLIDKMM